MEETSRNKYEEGEENEQILNLERRGVATLGGWLARATVKPSADLFSYPLYFFPC